MSTSRRVIPLLNRVLVEKLTAPTKTPGGIMLPETASKKIMEGTVVAVGPGGRNSEGTTVPMTLKEGDKVILPNYGGTEVKMDDKDLFMYSEEEILGKLE